MISLVKSSAFLTLLVMNTVEVSVSAAVISCISTLLSADRSSQGVRISALFVIMVVSSAATFFPVLAVRVRWMRVPIYVYLFARYFGTGVIIATGFIQ